MRFPWAPGQGGSPDGTAAAATQIDAFFGIGAPSGWNYRRMILHYASLAADAGGVDAFLIGCYPARTGRRPTLSPLF